MHLRQPSIDRGVTSFLWAFGLGLYLWLGMLAIGVEGATDISEFGGWRQYLGRRMD